MKIYINDFVEDLNYQRITLYYGNLKPFDILQLENRMNLNKMNKMYRFESTKTNNLFYVENCDLQIVNNNETLEDKHNIYNLFCDDYGFYVNIDF